MRYTIAAAILIVVAGPAAAMGPSTTDLPSIVNVKNCQRWAASQDSEAKEFWGLMVSGKSSSEVGVMRLTLSCLGDDQPEIINVGSSIGAAQQYCETHAQTPICRKRR